MTIKDANEQIEFVTELNRKMLEGTATVDDKKYLSNIIMNVANKVENYDIYDDHFDDYWSLLDGGF